MLHAQTLNSRTSCEEFLEDAASLLERGRVSQSQRENGRRSEVEVAESRGDDEEEGEKASGRVQS